MSKKRGHKTLSLEEKLTHATRERILASVKIFKIVVTLLVKGRISCGVVVLLVPD